MNADKKIDGPVQQSSLRCPRFLHLCKYHIGWQMLTSSAVALQLKPLTLGLPLLWLHHPPFVALVEAHGQECPNVNVNDFQWIPQDEHPCTVEQISFEEFERKFGPQGLPPLYPTPLVVATSPTDKLRRNAGFRELTRRDKIVEFFPPDFFITLSSSNSFSENRKSLSLIEYLQELDEAPETFPHQRSNETWYFFGETYSKEWKDLLESYDLPPCVACQQRDWVALSFGIGNRGSGVQWHVHGPGFAETIWGRKHWVLSAERPPGWHPDQTSRNWMESVYTQLTPAQRPLECTLKPGDILYFPDLWYHATINLETYTAFVSTFTQEHLLVKADGSIVDAI